MTTLRGVPEQIGRYRILSELGRGSMGHVYLALDPNIQRKVALKVFLPLLKVDAREELELQQRFIFEARAAGKLKHPGIVVVFDADTDPESGFSFIAMEWVDGPSLQDLIRACGPLPIPRAVASVEQVAVALDAAHREGLVHRDIKPANILLDADGLAKVTDFGIAKLASMSITGTGWIPGTPFYMSPEQVRNEGIDGRSDLYSLGVVLYQCLTNQVPFDGNSLASITYMILEIDPRPPQSINPSIPDALAAVIQRAMEKSPADRFQSGLEFAQALRETDAAAASDFVPASALASPQANGSSSSARPGTGTILLSAPTEGTEASLNRPAQRRDDPATLAGDAATPRRRPWAALSKRPRTSLAAALSLLFVLLLVPTLRSWKSEPPQTRNSPPATREAPEAPPIADGPPASANLESIPEWSSLPMAEAPEPPRTVGSPAASAIDRPIPEPGRLPAAEASEAPRTAGSSAASSIAGPIPEPGSLPAAEVSEAPRSAGSSAASSIAGPIPEPGSLPAAQDSEALSLAHSPPAAPEASAPTAGSASASPLAQAAESKPSEPREPPRSTKSARAVRSKTAERPARPATARLEVVFRNRLKRASLSVWIDEKKVWSRTVSAPKNFLKRARGRDVWTTIPLRAGKHVIDIRVSGAEGKIDLVKRTAAKFAGGEIKRLRVVMIPRKNLKLTWKDRSHG